MIIEKYIIYGMIIQEHEAMQVECMEKYINASLAHPHRKATALYYSISRTSLPGDAGEC